MLNVDKTNKGGGFTLIETMVAITIFLITIFLVTQVYVETIRMERVAYGLLNRDNSVRYALELMARDIRMADATTLPPAPGSNSLNFKVFNPGLIKEYTSVEYKLNDNKIFKDGKSITNSNVIITELNFEIDVANNDNGSQTAHLQPRVIISFNAKVGSSNPIFIQTSVTPRYPYIREI